MRRAPSRSSPSPQPGSPSPALPPSRQDSGSAAWDGSVITLPGSPQEGLVHAEAYFKRDSDRTIVITLSASGAPAAGCAMPSAVTGPSGSTPMSFGTDFGFGCNGTYTITALAETTNDSQLFPHDEATRSGTVAVAMPAPTVTGVSASGDGREITVEWNDMRAAAADLTGYVVTRQIDDGSPVEVASLGADETTFVDTHLPAEGGDATYSVASTRPSYDQQRLTSQSTSSEATPFIADPNATDGDGTTSPDGGTTTGGGTTTPGTTGGSTSGATGGSTTSGGTTSGGVSVRAPRLGISGAFLPPLLRPSVSVSPPTTEDGGFSEELPYGSSEPGGDEPVLPDDELASAFSDGAAGRGMAIPVATALVLAVWAFHLRFLARASRPVD